MGEKICKPHFWKDINIPNIERTPKIKKQKPDSSMGKGHEQTFLQRRYMNSQ